LIVAEFMSELSELEQRVFRLEAEGLGYRAMAPILCVEVNDARKAFRECERKRARFQLLHDTGRLCGYRSRTIQALLSGEGASERLARGAWAHVARCGHCRADHKTNARRLRRSFQEHAAALLPIPALAGHMGWLVRLDMRVRTVQERVFGYGSPPGTGGVRERALAMVIGGGAAVKLAAGAATVAVLAGGTIGASDVLHGHRVHHRHHAGRSSAALSGSAREPRTPPLLRATASVAPAPRAARQTSNQGDNGSARRARREPGGFAFLGVPSARAPRGPSARTASVSRPTTTSSTAAVSRDRQSGGGPFSP
jgi:hypothetical protein